MARILVVDDNPSVLQSLGYFLESAGHAVVLATNGTAGLRCAGEQPLDLVLLDIEMPDISGIDVCEKLHRDPTRRDVPVVMMTGRLLREVVGPARAAGARVVMGKPFDLEHLHATISRYLPAGKADSIAPN